MPAINVLTIVQTYVVIIRWYFLKNAIIKSLVVRIAVLKLDLIVSITLAIQFVVMKLLLARKNVIIFNLVVKNVKL
jgi:hypothetical protein